MNAIQNYGNVSVNSNYKKTNISPNFKALHIHKDPGYSTKRAIELLSDTKFFDADLIPTAEGFRLKLSHLKDFVWPKKGIRYNTSTGATDKTKYIFSDEGTVLVLKDAETNGKKIEYNFGTRFAWNDPKDPKPIKESVNTEDELNKKIGFIRWLDSKIQSFEAFGVPVELNIPYQAFPNSKQPEVDTVLAIMEQARNLIASLYK